MKKHRSDERTFEVGEIDGERFMLVSWPSPTSKMPSLTPAELDVLRLVALGKSNLEIAKARATSPRTIANQVSALLRKFAADSRLALMARLSKPTSAKQ
ncbi:MAG: LuxR C-terminal-related transcriptional regulator [Polyangiaceae bacterium]